MELASHQLDILSWERFEVVARNFGYFKQEQCVTQRRA